MRTASTNGKRAAWYRSNMKKYVYTFTALSRKSIPMKKIIPRWTWDLVLEYIFTKVPIRMLKTPMFANATMAQYGTMEIKLQYPSFPL